MIKKFELRDYQRDIINQAINSDKSTLIHVPTGGGKTVIAKEIILDLVGRLNKQVLFVAPKIILMEQTAEVFKSLNPHILHGINQYNKNHKVLISTIQTASRRDINPDVIIIDEIHYGFEGKMIERLIKDKPHTRIIGLSATPYDKNGEQLKGFDLVLDKYDIKYMIENKYLVNIESHVLTKIRKLDTVKITAGDYNLQELSKIVCDNQTILEIVGSTAEYILKYKKAIVFAVDINHAELLTKAYQHEGFTAKALHSNLSREEQEREIRRFEEGQTKILVSVLMLTTGFDVPDTDVAIIARPTKSQNLYKQMVGRVLRLADDKTHAVLLDCGNVIENLGFPLDPIKSIQTKKIADNQQKCEICESKNLKLKHVEEKSFWECEDCGHVKNIEHGIYECKLCHKLYTHDAKFIIKNNKLLLDCDICPYPTLISEYTGSEIFLHIDNKQDKKANINKSLVKILEEEKRKKEKSIIMSEEEIKKKKLKEKRNLKIQNDTLESIRLYELNLKRQRVFERFNTKVEKLQELKLKEKEKEKNEILKQQEIESLEQEIERLKQEITPTILLQFKTTLQSRVKKSVNKRLKKAGVSRLEFNDCHNYIYTITKMHMKNIFKNLLHYQVSLVNESFNLENFIKTCEAELCTNFGSDVPVDNT